MPSEPMEDWSGRHHSRCGVVSVQGERPEDVVREGVARLVARVSALSPESVGHTAVAQRIGAALAALTAERDNLRAERLIGNTWSGYAQAREEIDALAGVNEELQKHITDATNLAEQIIAHDGHGAVEHCVPEMVATARSIVTVLARAAVDREATLAGGGDEGVRVARAADPGVTPAASVDREAAAEPSETCAEGGEFPCGPRCDTAAGCVPGGAQTPEETT